MNFATVQDKSAPVGSMQTCEFSDLAAMLSHAIVSPSKEGPGWVPGYIEPGPRTGERVAHWDALALDVEGKAERLPDGSKRLIGPKAPTLSEMAAELELWGLAAVLHTTHTHEEPAADGDTLGPRYRVVLNPSRPILPAEIKPLGLAVVAMLGLSDCTDTKCLEPARLFFLPRCPEERAHLAQSAVLDGEVLDVDAILTQAKRSAEPPPRKAGPAGASVIASFNAQADIAHLLEQHGYMPKGRNRWMWHGSTSGLAGVVLLPDTGRVYSHHPGDPLHNEKHSHDAFSVWSILNHAGDFPAAVKAAARLLGMERTRAEPVDFSALVSGQVTNASTDNSASNDASFHRVSVADVLTNPEPPHPFLWGPYIPAEALTLLSAHGGTGKSGFGLQLAAHVALGREFLGQSVIRANTLFFSAEDGKKQLRLRLADICRNHQIDPEQLDESMHVLDATDAALLWQGDGPKRPGEPTGHYAALQRFIADHQIGLLIVDNASDSFGGDRFDKSDVTRFVRALVKLVRWQAGAVMLLSHVNRGTASKRQENSESYSDSVAWHNAARSRLFMEGEEGTTQRTLKHEKCNYGPKGQPLALEAMPGCGVRLMGADGVADEFKQAARRFADEQVHRQLLALVYEFAQRGEYVNPSPQANSANAWGMLRGEATFPAGQKRGDVLAHFRTMERNGHVCKEPYTKPNRHTGERWAITEKGHTFANLPFAPPAPACASDDFQNADALTQSDTGNSPVSAPATQGGYGGSSASAGANATPDARQTQQGTDSPAHGTLDAGAGAQMKGTGS